MSNALRITEALANLRWLVLIVQTVVSRCLASARRVDQDQLRDEDRLHAELGAEVGELVRAAQQIVESVDAYQLGRNVGELLAAQIGVDVGAVRTSKGRVVLGQVAVVVEQEPIAHTGGGAEAKVVAFVR